MELGQRLHMAHLRYVYVESREERSGVAEVVLMIDQIRLDLSVVPKRHSSTVKRTRHPKAICDSS